MAGTYTEQTSAVEELFAAFAAGELPLAKHSQALAASLVVYTGACYVTSVQVNNTNAAAQYVQMFDAIALPANGAIPKKLLTASGSSDKFVTWSLPGVFFSTGVVIGNSSTAATLTTGAADCFFDVQYVPVVWE